jgi:hypothetical protein
MKALLLTLLLTGVAQAQTALAPLTFYQASFGGVDNYHDSARIDNADFQDARNVLTDRGYLEKRFGSRRIIDGVQPGYPINYVKEFITQSNVKKFIIQTSTVIYATDFSAVPVQIATVNVNGITSSVSAYNKHYFVNGYDTAFAYDGTNVTLVPEIPTGCKYLMFADERLWCTNVSGLESTVKVSAYGDPADWTIPAVDPLPADASNAFTMDRQDGKPVTCAYYSPYGKVFWKRNKMFVVKGVDNDSYEKYRISDSVGCVDNRSVRLVQGVVTWLAEDGVYQWEGGSNPPTLISREIDNTIKSIRQSVSAADNQSISSYADFVQGHATTNGARDTWDALAVAGSIIPSSWTAVDTESTDFGLGTLSNITISTADGSFGLASASFSTALDLFTDNNYSADPAWTVVGTCSNLSVASGILRTWDGNNQTCYLHTSSVTYATGQWSIKFGDVGTAKGNEFWYYFVANTTNPGTMDGYALKHYLSVISGVKYKVNTVLYKLTGGTLSQVGAATYDNTVDYCGAGVTYTITRNSDYGFTVSAAQEGCATPGVMITATDTTYTASSAQIIKFVTAASGYVDLELDNIYVPARTTQAASYTSRVFDTGFTTPIGGEFSITVSSDATSTVTAFIRSSANNSTWSGLTQIANGARIPLTERYWQYVSTLTVEAGGVLMPSVKDVSLAAASTGTWDSHVLFLSADLSSWGQFAALSTSADPDVQAYYIRAATYAFAWDAATPAWVAQPNNVNVTCATGTYAQVRVVSSFAAATDTFKVDSFTLNWYNGDSKSVASLYYDGRYYLCANTSTGTLTNDLCMVYQRNKKWTLFDGQSWGALDLYNNYPYAGDGLTSSKIWRIIDKDVYFDDNTEAINAYAITKDFQFDGQNNSKILRQFYLEAYPNTASTVSLAYSVEKSTTYYTTSQSLQMNTPFNDEIKGMFPGFAKGRYAKFKFSNNVVNQTLKIDAYTVFGDIERLYRR